MKKEIKQKAASYHYRLHDGRYEKQDPRPLAIPVGFEKPESLQQKLARLVHDEVINQELKEAGLETFADADDFETGEDVDPRTPYEEDFDPLHNVTRDQEVRGGVVKEPSEQDYDKAKETLRQWKMSRRASDRKRRSADKEDKK